MAYVDKSFGNLTGNGSDFTVGSLSGLPTIPANATLDSVWLYFNAYRKDGSIKGGKVSVSINGTDHKVSDIERNKQYNGLSFNLTNYVSNSNGTLSYTHGSSISIRVYHNWWALGQADWTISGIYIRANYTIPTYTATFKNYDGTVLKTETLESGKTPTAPANPSRPADAQYTYTFSGWSPTVGAITANTTYTAQFTATVRKYTITWKNHDGTVLETDNNVEYGTTPTYNGSTPTKASTAQHMYTFSGWSPAVSAVTGNATYTAQFTATVRKYTVKWYNYDGTLLETDTDVPYGTKPTYNGATPTKPSDDYYSYGFAGWSPSTDEAIQGDKNFTAQFAQTDRYYTVRWVNASAVQGVEGALLETDEVKFDTQPDYNGATPKHPKQDTDPAFNYDFIGWSAKVTDPAKPDTELEKVKGDITYTAIYETTPKMYAVTVILFDGQSTTDIYEYGTEITIEAPEIVDFHQFIKWSDGDTRPSRTVTVTGEATYQAIYERISIPIKVNLEQVTGVYIVPDASIPNTGTIVYVINGTVPTVEIGVNGDMQTVDGWSFLVSNSIPDNGYPLKKLFITESGVTTRVY